MPHRLATLSRVHCFSYDTAYVLLVPKIVPKDMLFDLYNALEQCNMVVIIATYDFAIESQLMYSFHFTHLFVICQFCSFNTIFPIQTSNVKMPTLDQVRQNLLKEISPKVQIILRMQHNDCVVNKNCILVHSFGCLVSEILNFTLSVDLTPYHYRPLGGMIESYKGVQLDGSLMEMNLFPGQYSIFKLHSIDKIVIYCDNEVRTISSSPYYLLTPCTVTCRILLLTSVLMVTYVTTMFSERTKFSNVLFNSVLRYLLRQDTKLFNRWHIFLALGYYVLNICYEAQITSMVIKPNPPKVFSSVVEMFTDGYKFLLDHHSNRMQEEFVKMYGFQTFLTM